MIGNANLLQSEHMLNLETTYLLSLTANFCSSREIRTMIMNMNKFMDKKIERLTLL